MATFQEYHGISLAANSWIENLFVEQLSDDPAPVGPGRVWFNTTDKKFRQSTLNGEGGVIVRTFATEQDLVASVASLQSGIDKVASDLAAETTARQAADDTLTDNLAAETTARIAADAALQASISALGNAFNYIGTLNGGSSVDNPFDLANLAPTGKNPGDYYRVLTAGWFMVADGESTRYANSNDGLVFNTTGGFDIIDNTNSELAGTASEIDVSGSTDTGFVVGIATAFKDRVSTLESGLASEVTARQAGDAALQTAVDAEVARATAAEGVLTADLAAEVTARQAGDAAINTTIGSLGSLATTDKTSIVNAINEVKTLAGNGVSSLVTQLNSYRYTTTTTTAATSHTINHGLGSTLVDVCVWIDRGDGIWRNDMAAVSIIDGTSVKVDLTAARNIRVTVEKMTAFA